MASRRAEAPADEYRFSRCVMEPPGTALGPSLLDRSVFRLQLVQAFCAVTEIGKQAGPARTPASYDEKSHHPSDMRSQLGLLALAVLPLFAQGNYEVQVYGSDLVKPGNTMLEFHTNFTFQGEKLVVGGTYPTEHQFHESIEITHGFNEWFETGWYIFTSAGPGQGYGWVGDHIRPRIAVPERYKLPVGL